MNQLIQKMELPAPQLYVLKSIKEERQFRLDILDQNGAGAKDRFLSTLAAAFPEDQREPILQAFKFACRIDYDHVGLSPESYLAHPLRVTEMVMSYFQPVCQDAAVIALLHNVLEVSAINLIELEEAFGRIVKDSISNLTVDRERQWDPVYKRDYYQKIRQDHKAAGAVKVFDKLDNVFMLCLNDNEKIRTVYLDEIEEHVIPLAQECVPAVTDYFKAAAAEARIFGHLTR